MTLLKNIRSVCKHFASCVASCLISCLPITFIYRVCSSIHSHIKNKAVYDRLVKTGHVAKNVILGTPDTIGCYNKVYIEDGAILMSGFKIVMRADVEAGKFIMKKNAHAGDRLTVVTNNHAAAPIVGVFTRDNVLSRYGDTDFDVAIEEDAWLGANVTLLAGVTVGRGAIIGAGAVLRRSVPPYSMVLGNPAKVVSFVFTPDEIIEHEKALYPENERLPRELLEKNYEKYYLKRFRDIANYLK